ncbi:MAG: ATPase, T2SS/T4P/T4SS family [Pirellulaceae bacterium]
MPRRAVCILILWWAVVFGGNLRAAETVAFPALPGIGPASTHSSAAIQEQDEPAETGQPQSSGKRMIYVGVGAHFAWYKILMFAVVYLLWVMLADRINRDLLEWGEPLKMPPQIWNLINVLSFLAGLVCVLAIPIFWVGWPFFLVAAVGPAFVYRLIRASRLKASDALAFQVNPETANQVEVLVQDQGVELDFTPAGDDKDARTKALILARRSPAFPILKNLVSNMLIKRADLLLLDYTATEVNGRMQVDGAWHPLPPLNREEGDYTLVSFKHLAGLNPEERRVRQQGVFRCKFPAMDLKTGIEVLSQGVPTGERVQIKILRATGKDQSLVELGMWPESSAKLLEGLNNPGLSIISAPLRNGLSTTWRSSLIAMDRYTRDCIVVIDPTDFESEVENLQVKTFPENGSPLEVVRSALLAQPEVIVIPSIVNAETMDRLTDEVLNQDRTVVTRIHATTAAEAILRVFSLAKNKKQFVEAFKVATCQRLVRKLCDHCKQPVPVRPEFVQKLGGDPQQIQAIYTHFTPPPPGMVDEKGQPIEVPVCPKCQGFGYLGRTAIFEVVVNNEHISSALLGKPEVATLAAIAKKTGNLDQTQEAYRLVLAGITSVDEIKRVFQSK